MLLLSLSRHTFLSPKTLTLTRKLSNYSTSMSVNLQAHAFAGNLLKSKAPEPGHPASPNSALETLKALILEDNSHVGSSQMNFKFLPFRKGRPLASSSESSGSSKPAWQLGWISLADCKAFLEKSGTVFDVGSFVYLGSELGDDDNDDVVYWALDVSAEDGSVSELNKKQLCFVELRTLMVATDWADVRVMGQLAIAGNARALLEWHNVSRFCGHCGERTIPIDAGRRKECSNQECKKRIYPRVDPVVIMLVIDKENDRALLSRQSRFVPRMWSCLAGFIEPGESLEEAVRRETWEETGVVVGEVIYHSSQPWPVGPNSMPCQLMVGFFAYAKSVEINVDKEELEDAQWHSREDVKNALTFAEYEKAQSTAAAKVYQMCKGVEKGQNFSSDFNLESGELAPMFIPGPFAIAHHLISSWINQSKLDGSQMSLKQHISMSNL